MLKKDYPELAKYWNYKRNDEIGVHFEDISHGSHKKVWWICNKGHEWEMAPHDMSRGCPYCSSERLLPGFNDLATTRKDLLDLWNYEKNETIQPTEIMAHSSKKVWWKCNKGHEWEATPNDISRGSRCPYCSSQKILVGENDLATLNPELADEWNYERNDGLAPQDVMPNSNKKVWWKCKSGHEWKAGIADRNRGNGCPICSNKKVLPGYNDLVTTNPKLANEWNYGKNGSLSPRDITSKSGKKVWWRCANGHEWETSISNRTSGRGCPICSNKKVLPGYNDITTLAPQLLTEWNYEKNGNLTPQCFTPGSNKKVWWKCKNGHEWQAVIGSRVKDNNVVSLCPVCSRNLHISFSEKILFFYIKKTFPDAIENYRPSWLNKKELDIYIPSKKVGIEYDGERYHKSKRDAEKDKLCKEQGITLIRIRERGAEKIRSSSIVFTLPLDHHRGGEHLAPALRFLEEQLNTNLDINLTRDYDEIRSLVINYDLENSVAKTHPEILDEWDYEKNGAIGNTPENVSAGSGIIVWWKCKNGHSYRSTLNNKTSFQGGCPYCSSHKILPGFNDLATKNPRLASEWNYEKNGELTPQDVMAGSGRKVWWKCKNNHEWQATILSRNRGNGCPYCAREKGHKN